MSVLVRDDGVRFVLRAYREQLARSKRSLLKQHLRFLAEQHGEYVHLSTSNTDPTYLNAVFSADSGFLLGEIIWQHLGQPGHLIYCERHPQDPYQTIIIVVIDHTIYLDTLVTDEEISSELLPLLTLTEPFVVITFGDVPLYLSEQKTLAITYESNPVLLTTAAESVSYNEDNISYSLPENKSPTSFLLPSTIVKHHIVLEKSIIPELSSRSEYELQLLPRVLTSKLLSPSIPWALITVTSTLVVLLAIWFFYPTPPEQVTTTSSPQPVVVSPYSEFYQALNSPGSQTLVETLTTMINNLSSIPGWQLQTIDYDGNQSHITLLRLGGDIIWVNNFAKQNNYDITLTTNGADLTTHLELPLRVKPLQIYPAKQIMSFIDEHLSQVLDDDALFVSPAEIHGDAQQIKITLNLNGVSPALLLIIGRILGNDLPVAVDRVQLTEDDSNLLNGTIQFSVWGK